MTADQFCDRCGTRVSPGAAFCGSCGQPVAQAAPPQAWAAPEPPPPPASWQAGQAPEPPQAYTPAAYPPPPQQYQAGPQYAAPAPPPAGYQGAPGYQAPPGAAPARQGVQVQALTQLLGQTDIVVIAGGVLLALAIVLPIYGGSNPFNGFSLLNASIWTVLAPLVLAVGSIGIGVLVRQRQVSPQLAIGAILAIGAVGTAMFGGYFLESLTQRGLGLGIGSLVGAVGGVAVLAAGIVLARQHPIR